MVARSKESTTSAMRTVVKMLKARTDDPARMFDLLFASLIAAVGGVRLLNWLSSPRELPQVTDSGTGGTRSPSPNGASTECENKGMLSLRRRFLAVFWLLKLSDWMQGPYFFDVYASKTVNGKPIDESIVSKLFLTGFTTSALLGPSLGRLVDSSGRKAGTLAFALFYGLSALSTRASSVAALFAGRVAGGIGTSLLNAAPESWMVSEHLSNDFPVSGIGDNFSLAYFGDAIVAIVAGQIADRAARRNGPTGPFILSTAFLAAGAALVATTWRENTAPKGSAADDDSGVTVLEAWNKMKEDPRILAVGAVQALFEGAMYIFVMQWPPALIGVVKDGKVPFGKVFSCFMASCMLGSSVFANLARKYSVERITVGMLGVATAAMAGATARLNSLPAVVSSFFMFEACVGIYFPSIGTLRSKYIPESHSAVIKTLIGIPLNVIVVSVMLSAKRLGMRGSMACCTLALACALSAQCKLLSEVRVAQQLKLKA